MGLLENLLKPTNVVDTKKILEETVKDAYVNTAQSEPKEEQKEIGEWEWIEGYKGTNPDMTCRGFQFELNKKYICEEDILLCCRGFHFCKELKDTFSYYPLHTIGNRYFKVKALVNMELMKKQIKEYNNSPYYPRYMRNISTNEKLVAKEIILTEEISIEELFPYIKEKYPLIETVDDWNFVQKLGYESFKRNWFINKMKDTGFGEAFLCVLYDNIKNKDLLTKTINYAKALKEENVSKDMAVYLIMNYIK